MLGGFIFDKYNQAVFVNRNSIIKIGARSMFIFAKGIIFESGAEVMAIPLAASPSYGGLALEVKKRGPDNFAV